MTLEQVIVVNDQIFQEKKNKFIKDGPSKLQVVSDFDRTITKNMVNGVTGDSCYRILRSIKRLSSRCKSYTDELYMKYYPIEIDHQLTREQKLPHMIKWYELAHEALVREGLHKDDLEEAVQRSNVTLREKAKDVVNLVEKNQVPLLLFSAGVGNIIQEVMLQKYGNLASTTHIIANWMEYNAEGTLDKFSEPLIHVFNKNESHVTGHDYEDSVKSRSNVILIGDSLGDGKLLHILIKKYTRTELILVDMSNGLSVSANILKIGFLNHNVIDLLPQYEKVYDVIITKDGSMQFVLDLLQQILGQETIK